jgi:ubiquitin conjugation factor E4 B
MYHVFEVDFDKVSSDSFLVNTQSILLRFAEPFLDSNYSKLDRIDSNFLTTSSRLSLDDETRINATSNQLKEHREELAKGGLSE